jgi:hypothetical protein
MMHQTNTNSCIKGDLYLLENDMIEEVQSDISSKIKKN